MKFNARAMNVSSNAKKTFKLLPRFFENITSNFCISLCETYAKLFFGRRHRRYVETVL